MGSSGGIGSIIVTVGKKSIPSVDFSSLVVKSVQGEQDRFRKERSAELFLKAKITAREWAEEVKQLAEEFRQQLERESDEWKNSLMKLAALNIFRLEEELKWAEAKYGNNPGKRESLQCFQKEWEDFKDKNPAVICDLKQRASSLHTIVSTRSIHSAGKGRSKTNGVPTNKKKSKGFSEL